MIDAAPTRAPAPRRPLATRPWFHWARCAICREPLGVRDSAALDIRGGASILVHDACASPAAVEMWS